MKTPKAISARMEQIVRAIDRTESLNKDDEASIVALQTAIVERNAKLPTLRTELGALQFAISAYGEPQIVEAPQVFEISDADKPLPMRDRILIAMREIGTATSAAEIRKRLGGDDVIKSSVSAQLTFLMQGGKVVHKGIGLWELS